MSSIPRRIAAGVPAAILVVGAVLTIGGVASAASIPPWEPGGSASTDPNEVGGLLFFDASGDSVTGGNLSDPIAVYVQGTTTLRAGDSSASLYGYLPKSGVVPGSWNGEILAGPTLNPATSAPAPVSHTLPVVEPGVHDLTIDDLASDYPNTDTSSDGYAGLYEIRLLTTGTGAQTTTYDSADISVGATTWSVVYSNTQVSTTTKLAVSPSKSAYHGTTVTLTATVTPAAAAGSVQFRDGSTVLKTVAVAGGTASFSTKKLSDAVHKLSAKFVPTDSTAYTGSTSSHHSITVKAHLTKVSLKASKASVTKGKKLSLTATETPAVAGKVAFYDGSKKLATVAVKKGKATFSSTKLAVGTHKLKARFTPSNLANDSASTSKLVKVKVKK